MNELLPIILVAVGVVIVTGIAKKIHVSAPIVLLVAGILVALLPGVPAMRVTPDVVLFILLPPLLYAAALNSSLIAIRANARPIGVLAISMVLVTSAMVGLALSRLLPEVGLAAGLALGAVVAPPDAVAATAVARRAGMPRRLVTILEGESLFNDATALVTLRVAVAAVAGSIGFAHAVGQFFFAAAIGAAIGLAAGFVLSQLRTRGLPTIVITSLSLVTPFGVYLAAEEAHASGVTAVVVAGLLLAHRSPRDEEPAARLADTAIWSTVQFLLEGAVFALIGLQLPEIVRGVSDPVGTTAAVCAAVLGICVAVRPAWLFGIRYIARISPWGGDGDLPWPGLTVISWAGMRGVVSLAAAQSLPLDFPRRNLLLLATVVVIVGTLGVQGVTLPWVIRHTGVQPPDPRQDALQIASAQEQAGQAALSRLDEIAASEELPDRIVESLRAQTQFRMFTDWERLGAAEQETPSRIINRLRREMAAAERDVLVRLRDTGELDEEVLRRVQRRLDLEESLIAGIDREDELIEGHQEVLPAVEAPCADLRDAPRETPVANPHECPDCIAEGLTDWVHLRACLTCGHIGCCDSSPARHADRHYHETNHPVMGSAEDGESWRWCYRHARVG